MSNKVGQNSWTPVLSCLVLAQILADLCSIPACIPTAGVENVLPPRRLCTLRAYACLQEQSPPKIPWDKVPKSWSVPRAPCDSPCLQCPHCLLLRVTLVSQIPRWRQGKMRDVTIGWEGWWPSVQGQKIWIHWQKGDTFQYSWKEEKRQTRQFLNVWWRLKAINKWVGGTSFCRWVLRSLCANVERKIVRWVELQHAHTF